MQIRVHPPGEAIANGKIYLTFVITSFIILGRFHSLVKKSQEKAAGIFPHFSASALLLLDLLLLDPAEVGAHLIGHTRQPVQQGGEII